MDETERAWGAAELDLLMWISAASRDAIVSAYATRAADLNGIDDADPEQGARRLLRQPGALTDQEFHMVEARLFSGG